MFDQKEAAEEQIAREVREETLLLIKEAGLLLEKFEEFKREQNAAATIIKDTQRANRELQNYFKLISCFLFADKETMDFIQNMARQSNDTEFSKWLKNMRTLKED